MNLYCCGCQSDINARLTNGVEIYPYRPDLGDLPFWKCDACNNYVGCHHKSRDHTKPLGCIPTKEIRDVRQHIHQILDPIWKSGRMTRGKIYEKLAKVIGKDEYHTAEIRSVEEARNVYRMLKEMAQ